MPDVEREGRQPVTEPQVRAREESRGTGLERWGESRVDAPVGREREERSA